jgi:hypothetical protein
LLAKLLDEGIIEVWIPPESFLRSLPKLSKPLVPDGGRAKGNEETRRYSGLVAKAYGRLETAE